MLYSKVLHNSTHVHGNNGKDNNLRSASSCIVISVFYCCHLKCLKTGQSWAPYIAGYCTTFPRTPQKTTFSCPLYVMTHFLPRWKVVAGGSAELVDGSREETPSRKTRRQLEPLTWMVFCLLSSNGKNINVDSDCYGMFFSGFNVTRDHALLTLEIMTGLLK